MRDNGVRQDCGELEQVSGSVKHLFRDPERTPREAERLPLGTEPRAHLPNHQPREANTSPRPPETLSLDAETSSRRPEHRPRDPERSSLDPETRPRDREHRPRAAEKQLQTTQMQPFAGKSGEMLGKTHFPTGKLVSDALP